jgi:hypothetical protein
MVRINPRDFGTARPKLTPEDLPASPCLLTLDTVERVEVPDEQAPNGTRPALTVMFTEFPERPLWLNVSQIETLVSRLGEDGEKWKGQVVPVERTVAEFKGQRFPKVRVVPEDGWDDLLSAGKGAARPKATAPVKASRGRR